MDAAAVQQIASEKRIKPHMNLNDVDLFDPDEFQDARSLLRASSVPTSIEELVRPAEPTTVHAEPETLLRAAPSEADDTLSAQIQLPASHDLEEQQTQQLGH
jgi:hypothetical protein